MHPVEQRAIGHVRAGNVLIEILVVPTRRHSGGKKGFDFRGQIKGFVVDGVVERLNAEAVTSCEKHLVRFVPKHEGKLAAQMLHAMSAEFLVQMQRNLTVGACSEKVSAILQLASLALEVIKFAVNNNMNPFVFVPDWLIAAPEVNDAQPRMTEADVLIFGQPEALAIWTAVAEDVRGALQFLC